MSQRALLRIEIAMALEQVREMRSAARHPPGFYKKLHSTSTADLLSLNLPTAKRQRLMLEGSPAADLPSGVYLVERIIAERRSKKVKMCLSIRSRLINIQCC